MKWTKRAETSQVGVLWVLGGRDEFGEEVSVFILGFGVFLICKNRSNFNFQLLLLYSKMSIHVVIYTTLCKI